MSRPNSDLVLGRGLRLPLSAVTEKIAWLGRTGGGKTYGAMKLAEEMLTAGAQIVVLDAVGKWYGLRVPGDGPGFPIPVFGGLHGDYPLESTGGRLVADLLVDRATSAVLDVSQFTHAEQTRFAHDFATHFFHRKKSASSAVHVFLEEAQEFIPQNPQPGEQAMLGAFERLWKLGRNFGIGGSLISQRPQELHKKALNQTGTLFVFGMTGPHERKAIREWVSAQGIDEDIAEILPNLKPGQPKVWSPTLGLSVVTKIGKKRTADVSSTPTVDAGRAKERPLTPLDAEELRAAMAETVERAEQSDPRALRAKLADRDSEISRLTAKLLDKKPERVDVPVVLDKEIARVQKAIDRAGRVLTDALAPLLKKLDKVQTVNVAVTQAVLNAAIAHEFEKPGPVLARLFDGATAPKIVNALDAKPLTVAGHHVEPDPHAPGVVIRRRKRRSVAGDARAILDMIGNLEARGMDPDAVMVARWLGIHPRNSAYVQTIARLRRDGVLDGLRIVSAAHYPSQVATGWDALLKACETGRQQAIVSYLKGRHNCSASVDEAAAHVDVHPRNSAFVQDVARLREMGVITERAPLTLTEGALR